MTLSRRLPLLISIPHGGTGIPGEVRGKVALDAKALQYFSDPGSFHLFGFHDLVDSLVTSPVSRVLVDLNRPPYHRPPRHHDGVVKFRTSLGQDVWKEGMHPDLRDIHQLLLNHYFPYHARIDSLLDRPGIAAALDCHTMVGVGLPGAPDQGQKRPLICLGNSGDGQGSPKFGVLPTCPESWIQDLARLFRERFPEPGSVALNQPYSGGFISNAHYWHKGISWIQIEVNRSLFESGDSNPENGSKLDHVLLDELKSVIREVLEEWSSELPGRDDPVS